MDIKSIIETYVGGCNLKDTAAIHGTTFSRVHRVLIQNGIPRRTRWTIGNTWENKLSTDDRKAILMAVDSGERKTDVARRFNVSHQRVDQLCNPDKERARSRLKYCIKSGLVIKKACAVCDSRNVQAHHPDYSKPLEVIWLCRKHHVDVHYKK